MGRQHPSPSPLPLPFPLSLCLSLCLVLALPRRTAGTPFSPEDSFKPICGSLPSANPVGGWKPWSKSSTWGGGAVPGVGPTAGANATIPCNVGVILDVPLVTLTLLDIQGALKFQDDPSTPSLEIQACFVLVQGRLTIGTPAQQFSQRATITLTPNPNHRAPYAYTSNPPADPQNPRDLGHKAFVVVGGQVDLHGLPGAPGMPAWTKLAANAFAGDTSVVVKGNVSGWPVGAPLVVAPSDYFPDQEDVAVLTQKTQLGGDTWQLQLSQGLQFNHFGDPLGVPDGFGGYIDETAEVALLSRNIVITGTDEAAPYDLEGGHFMVFMTNTQQLIEGVEFLRMGQQGKLGRYSLHFHLCGNQSTSQSVIRKNLILHSKQRCINIHATFNAYVDSNVAYNTSGHCFMLEDGSESGNTFVGNLGMRTRAATVLIPSVADPTQSDETDDSPATFWIPSVSNNFVNNSAAGSDDSGFWIQLGRFGVRGLSATWPRFKGLIPLYASNLGTYSGNTAHSNWFAGLRFYWNGYYPRDASGVPQWATFTTFTFYKNVVYALEVHNMQAVEFADCAFADNPWGAHFQEAQGVRITRARFVGLSKNYGNPSDCQSPKGWRSCAPVAGCGWVPLAAGQQGRSLPYAPANQSLWGVVLTESRETENGAVSSTLQNCTFSGYDATCRPAAGIAVGANRADYWNAGNTVLSAKFDTAGGTNPVYLYPWMFTEANGVQANGGEVATFFALRVGDGSLVGSRGGYVVANNSNILPPPSFPITCSWKQGSNAWFCPQACYRTVQISYTEPKYSHYPKYADIRHISDGPRVLGDFSSITVLRVEDGARLDVEGNLREYDAPNNPNGAHARFFPVSLLGSYTYEVQYSPGRDNLSFVPPTVYVEFKDGAGCGQGVTLHFRGGTGGSAGAYSWKVGSDNWYACGLRASGPAQAQFACSTTTVPTQQVLEISMTSQLPSAQQIVLAKASTGPAPCGAGQNCQTLRL